MKQYVYRPDEAGLPEWPSGQLRLEGIDITDDPKEADLFVCPGPLMLFQDPHALDRFPFMKGNEERHTFFDVSDYETLYRKPCIFIRCNTRTWYLKTDPNTISWPWPVENFSECVDVPSGGFKYDVSFQGWLSSEARKLSAQSCARDDLKYDIAAYSDFCGYIYHTPEGIRRRAEFRRSMRESRIALCPESIPGVFPYRFFEAMSAGRVPLLIGSNYVLPFADETPYSEFCWFLPADQAHLAGEFIRRKLDRISDTELIETGKQGRRYWEIYLNREDWPRAMADAVKKHLTARVH